MLKFKDLAARDKRNRYRRFVEFPTLIIFVVLSIDEAPYLLGSSLFTLTLVVDLLFFGVLSGRSNYKYTHLFFDAILLFAANFLSNLIFSPIILTTIYSVFDFSLSEYSTNLWTLVVSILLTYGIWYVTILVQDKVFAQSMRWKRQVTSLFREAEFE